MNITKIIKNHETKMHDKRAAIEVQFNWIFVMIVGFVLFLFIIGIIVWNAKQVENGMSEDLINQIVTSIRGKQQLSNTYNEMEFTRISLSMSCDANTLLSDIKSSSSQRQSLPVEIIFSPREITTNKLIIMTEDFSMPFVVTRFLYMTSPDYTFIINGNGALENQLFAEFQGNISRQEVESSPLKSLSQLVKDHPNHKIICIGDDNKCPNDKTYDYIKIVPAQDAGLFDYGTITYHRKPNINQNTVYITKQGLLAAIFSDNKNYYECQMNRTFNQFEIKRKLYYKRAELLQQDLNTYNPTCAPVMILPMSTLYNMKNMRLLDYQELYDLSGTLVKDNRALEFQSCPVIY